MRAVVGGTFLTLGVGCGLHAPKQPAAPRLAPPSLVLPVVARQRIDPDPNTVPNGPASTPTRPPQGRQLTAAECRRAAIRNAPFADDLDNHPDNKAASLHPWCKPTEKAKKAAHIGTVVRGYTADELRNRAAGEALEQFFQLAQAEGQYDLLLLGQSELQTQIAATEKAFATGLHDVGVDALRAQLLGLVSQAAQLEAAIGSLNASLSARLGLTNDPFPLWPDDPLSIRSEVVDVEQAVRTGLHYRPDLNALRALLPEDDEAGAEMRQVLLDTLNPLLRAGQSSSDNPLKALSATLAKQKGQFDATARQQIEGALASRERQAEAEIRAAVSVLTGHRAAAAARAIEVKQGARAVAELEKRQAQGVSVTAELTKARLDLLRAKGDLLKAQAEWNAAEAKLRQAMGLLVRE